MEINGRELQLKLIKNLEIQIEELKRKGITPSIVIVTLGPEETWEAYVGQKIKLSKKLGIKAKIVNLKGKSEDEILAAISNLNRDNSVHGLIVQRPFPTYIDTEKVIQSISKEKDIDGFRNDSLYQPPIFLAVKEILTHVSQLLNEANFQNWLLNQAILVIGKGETAGKPVINALQKLKIQPQVIDSKTQDAKNKYEKADILIFAIGKRIDVPFNLLKKSSILIGIGLHRKNDKLAGDFDENEAKDNVLYYTPSPGGVGPLNLYFLFENLVKACQNQS